MKVSLDEVEVALAANSSEDPHSASSTTRAGTSGTSVAGEVVAVGSGITDLAPGDLVACAGAGGQSRRLCRRDAQSGGAPAGGVPSGSVPRPRRLAPYRACRACAARRPSSVTGSPSSDWD